MEVSNQDIKNARKIFHNYRRIKMEIKQIENSIEFTKRNIESSINQDIHSASVSHAVGGNGGSSGSVNVNKIPNIAENIDKMRKQYNDNLAELNRKKNILSTTSRSVEIFISSLEWTDRTLITRLYADDTRKSYDEVSSELCQSTDALKKRERRLMQHYVKTSHINILDVLNSI